MPVDGINVGMFFSKKKSKKDKEEKDSKDKGSRSKKQPEATGPRWASLVVMLVSVLIGLFFWVYGNFERLISGEWRSSESKTSEKPVVREVVENEDGLIIFEKR